MSIVVTGGSGLVGSYLKKILPDAIYLSSKDFDLTKESDIDSMLSRYKPERIIHLAARVGGIIDNINCPAEYFDDNIIMNTLLIKKSYENGVKYFTGILSTCIYPDISDEYPMKEYNLHDGPPTKTNFSYGYAKRSMAVQIDAYNRQYGTKYNYIIPCNLYGTNDKDEESKSHFVTALLKKIYDSDIAEENQIILFGDGTPLRQFMHAKDLALAIKMCIDNDINDSFNVAPNENYSIKEIAQIALSATETKVKDIIWDPQKPNGQHRKDVDNHKMLSLLPHFKFTKLEDGIREVYREMLK